MATNILLIEDDADQVLIIQDTLESASRDFNLEIVADPELLDFSSLDRFDAVLCDYNLPNIKGTDLIKKILATREMLIIMLTGIDDPKIIIEAFENGAQDYIVKSDNILEALPFIIEKNQIEFQTRLENFRNREEKIRYEVRNKTLQQMITTLAHYINNSTTAISGFAQLCQFEPDNKKMGKLFEVIQREIRRISAVLIQLEELSDHADIKMVDYVDITNGMFDIEKELKHRLDALYSEESSKEESYFQ